MFSQQRRIIARVGAARGYTSSTRQLGPAAAASQNPTFQRSKYAAKLRKWFRRNMECKRLGNSFISPTRSGTTEIYIFGPAGAGIQNKICNIHLIDIVLQVQKYLEVQVFLVLQKYLEYQKQWNCSKLSERDTDMQNNIVKLRQRVRQG